MLQGGLSERVQDLFLSLAAGYVCIVLISNLQLITMVKYVFPFSSL